jgi:hypothetical protein
LQQAPKIKHPVGYKTTTQNKHTNLIEGIDSCCNFAFDDEVFELLLEHGGGGVEGGGHHLHVDRRIRSEELHNSLVSNLTHQHRNVLAKKRINNKTRTKILFKKTKRLSVSLKNIIKPQNKQTTSLVAIKNSIAVLILCFCFVLPTIVKCLNEALQCWRHVEQRLEARIAQHVSL